MKYFESPNINLKSRLLQRIDRTKFGELVEISTPEFIYNGKLYVTRTRLVTEKAPNGFEDENIVATLLTNAGNELNDLLDEQKPQMFGLREVTLLRAISASDDPTAPVGEYMNSEYQMVSGRIAHTLALKFSFAMA